MTPTLRLPWNSWWEECTIKKALPILLILTLLCLIFVGEMIGRYDVDWMIGKTSERIQKRYGEFDGHSEELGEDGLYKNCYCIYIVQTGKRDLFGDQLPTERLYVIFDDNGIAIDAYIQTDGGG